MLCSVRWIVLGNRLEQAHEVHPMPNCEAHMLPGTGKNTSSATSSVAVQSGEKV